MTATLSNELYLSVLPLIHMGSTNFGLTEQTVTLFPDKSFATLFFPDQVQDYINLFKTRADTILTGGHVTGYECHPEPTEDGRVIIRVTQNVR